MWRSIHSFSGLWGMVLITVLSSSGAVLSIYPAVDGLSVSKLANPNGSVADLLGKLSPEISTVETLVRKPSGKLIASYVNKNEMLQQVTIDANTGAVLKPVLPAGPLYTNIKHLHRSLFLDDSGKAVSGFGALLMAVLCIGGFSLLVTRMGGLKRLFSKVKGDGYRRYHTLLARMMVLPLLVSSLTGIYLVLIDFELFSLTTTESHDYPQSRISLTEITPAKLQGLADIPLEQLIELIFPVADDPKDVFTAMTSSGLTTIDRYSGKVLEFVPATQSEVIFRWFYALHTGEGLALVGLFLGFNALLVPIMGVTGIVTRWQRVQSSRQKIKGNFRAEGADIVVLVGTEGGTSWEFARSLHRDLGEVGYKVHVGTMNEFKNQYSNAQHVLFLTSTYGDGSAPDSAQRFKPMLAKMDTPPDWSYAILGFGDRAFPNFCQFAKTLDQDLQDKSWRRSLATCLINRQSAQAFTQWGRELAKALGTELSLNHQIDLPESDRLTLVEHTLYGEDTDAATAILRFRAAGAKRFKFKRRFFNFRRQETVFTPGDLLGILPPGSGIARYYSVASKPSNTEVEICVKRQVDGECSTFLHQLSVGDTINYFCQANEGFQPVAGRKPIIMVSAGTGIAPFMGMVRANDKRRAIHFFWGGRDPNIDYLYQQELDLCEKLNLVTNRHIAFSRVEQGSYVQNKISENAVVLYSLIKQGASIMVCGGDPMAQAVSKEFNHILEPIGLDTLALKARGQYLEDIF